MNHKLAEFYLILRYGKKKLKRLRSRSILHVKNFREMGKMSNSELITHLKKELGPKFKSFFEKAISTSTVDERLEAMKK